MHVRLRGDHDLPQPCVDEMRVITLQLVLEYPYPYFGSKRLGYLAEYSLVVNIKNEFQSFGWAWILMGAFYAK